MRLNDRATYEYKYNLFLGFYAYFSNFRLPYKVLIY